MSKLELNVGDYINTVFRSLAPLGEVANNWSLAFSFSEDGKTLEEAESKALDKVGNSIQVEVHTIPVTELPNHEHFKNKSNIPNHVGWKAIYYIPAPDAPAIIWGYMQSCIYEGD